ncbi:MAG TPA: hypothetical protein VMQ83_01730 [Gammaproteobacteria bacterium]|nr:hypothetical protein [Gammaproteobacteria bacterium]
MTRILALACLLAAATAVSAEEFPYELRYDFTFQPDDGYVEVSLTLGEGAQHVRWMRFRIDPERIEGFEADGELERDGKHLTWTPPDDGGRLKYRAIINHRRGERFDARMTEDWALFRGDDVVPPARLLQEAGAEAEAELHVHLPEGWSFATSHERLRPGVYRIENPARGFDRPTGWMMAGRIGVRRERIAGVDVAVAGPLDQGIRRMDLLAFMNWNLPELRALVDELPERLLVVSARDDMWRGGLSGPNSLYLHADRPLVSENGTSTPLHELVHVVTSLRSRDGGDWIVEGLAEYYSLKLMWRSGTLTKRRYQRAFRLLGDWGGDLELGDLHTDHARGAVTARAVVLMRKLDNEIHRESGKKRSLDDVVKRLVNRGEAVDLERLRAAVEAVMGNPAKALAE